MKALLLIDIQNDFMPGGALPVPDGDIIIEPINQYMPSFDIIVATQDWHPVDHKSFASMHTGKKELDSISLHGYQQTLWPDHCIQGTYGAEFYADLDTKPIAAIFRKGMNKEIDSYSGFYDNGKQTDIGLAAYLRSKHVTHIFFCGLAADVCVYYSLKDAIAEGFHCTLLEAGTRPLDVEQFKIIKKELIHHGVNIEA